LRLRIAQIEAYDIDVAVEQIEKEKDSVDAEIEDGQCPMCFDVLDGESGRITVSTP